MLLEVHAARLRPFVVRWQIPVLAVFQNAQAPALRRCHDILKGAKTGLDELRAEIAIEPHPAVARGLNLQFVDLQFEI